jgi:hypothetical protein
MSPDKNKPGRDAAGAVPAGRWECRVTVPTEQRRTSGLNWRRDTIIMQRLARVERLRNKSWSKWLVGPAASRVRPRVGQDVSNGSQL